MPAPSQPATIDQPSVNPSVITYTSALGFPLPIKSRKDMPDSLGADSERNDKDEKVRQHILQFIEKNLAQRAETAA